MLFLLLLVLLAVGARADELRYLPDGTVLTADANEVRLWRGEEVVLKLPVPGLHELEVTPDGKTLAVTWGVEKVALYDLPSGKLRWQGATDRPRKREAASYSLDLSPNGRWLLTQGRMFGDTDPLLRLWDGGQAVLKLPGETQAAWASDNRLLRIDGATAFLSSGPGWRKAHGLVQDSPILSWSQREGQVVTLSSTGDGPEVRAWIWDLGTGKLATSLALQPPADRVEISPDGTRLLVSDQDSMKYQLWDVPGKRLVSTGMGLPTFAGPTVIVNQPASVRALRAADGQETARVMHDGPRTVSPDGSLMATHDLGAGPVTIWDLSTGARLGTVPQATRVAFSPDGTRLAVGLPGNKMKLYDPRRL